MRLYLTAAILTIALLITVVGQADEACTIALKPGESIQAAIDAAPDSAVICLPAGTWKENIVNDKPVTLRGAGDPSTAGGHVLSIQVKGMDELVEEQRESAVDKIIRTFQARCAAYGLSGVRFVAEGMERITVELPVAVDPQEAINLLGEIGLLEFRAVEATDTDPNVLAGGDILPDRENGLYYSVTEPLITNSDIVEAKALLDTEGRPYISISFTEEGAKKFARAVTDLAVGQQLAFVLDGVVYTAPKITQSIKDLAAQGWKAVQDAVAIQGVFTQEETKLIAAALRSQVLPHKVKIRLLTTEIHQINYGPAIGISADAGRVMLEGLVVNGTITASGTSEVTIDNCSISCGYADAIQLGGSAHVTITGCVVTGSNAGIVLWNTARTIISNTTVSKNARGGIELWEETAATIRNCTVVDNQLPGILMQNNAEATIEHCVLQSNEYGVALSKSAHAEIKACNIAKNDIGVVCWDKSSVKITNCHIVENKAGITLTDGAQAKLIGNEITRNDNGIILFDKDCTDTDQVFHGYITGHSNVIPASDEPDGNASAVCPSELSFLTSAVGGTFDYRK